MDENYSLNEGMLERLGSCEAYSTSPLIIWERHAIDRSIKDRNFIDAGKIKGFNAKYIQDYLLTKCLPKYLSEIKSAWESANNFSDNLKKLPRFTEVNFVIRTPFKFKYFNNRTNKYAEFIVEATVQGTYNTVFSPSLRNDINSIYQNTKSFDEINKFLANNTPKFKEHFLSGEIGFNKPYIFIETFVFGLLKPSNYPKGFVKHENGESKTKGVWVFFNEPMSSAREITYFQYQGMYDKARTLKEISKYRLVDLIEKKTLSILLDINKEEK